MPYLNGTGPMGQGPMTGRGLGRCNPGYGRGLSGYGYGRGRGFGFGRGRGWRFWGNYGYPDRPDNYSPQEEKNIIQEDIAGLQAEIKALESRLAELKGSKTQNNKVK